MNVLKRDPTRSITLRRKQTCDVGRNLKELSKQLGVLRFDQYTPEQFTHWIQHRVNEVILSRYHESLWKRYSYEFFKKGIQRVFTDSFDTYRNGVSGFVPDGQTVGGLEEGTGSESGDADYRGLDPAGSSSQRAFSSGVSVGFRQGRKEEFIRGTFNRDDAFGALQLLQVKAWQEIIGATSDLVHKLTRSFTDSIIRKLSFIETKALFGSVMRIYSHRLTTVINTEGVRAHGEGQLYAMEELGISEVTPDVEELSGSEGGHTSPCVQCSAYREKKFPLSEAHGLIPFHPNCYCCWSVK